MLAPNYEASSAVPGAQNVDVGPGNKEKLPQAETNVAASRKLFQPWFSERAFDNEVSEELVADMMRRAGSYELKHGCKRPRVEARLCRWGPRAPAPPPGHPVVLRHAGVDAVRVVPGHLDGQAPRGAALPDVQGVPGRT